MNRYFLLCLKHFLLSIFILVSIQLNFEQLIAQTKNWYVDKNGTGANNGITWANAYNSFDNINWADVNAGDTVYISGGTDSTVYQETLTVGASGIDGYPIVITKGKDAGHNGLVIIDGQNTRQQNIYMVDRDYIKIINLKLRDALIYDHIGNTGRDIYAYLSDNFEIDSCEIIYNGTVGIMLITCDNAKVTYNNIYQDTEVTTLTSDMGISLKWSCDNVEIAHNTILMRNTNNGNAIDNHKDLIFVEGVAPYNVNGSIHHNFLMHDIPNTVERVTGIYGGALEGTWEVYNNILVVPGALYNLPFSLRSETASNNFVVKIYNNTVVSSGTSDHVLDIDYADSIFVYNNIFYKPAGQWQIVQINNTPTYLGMNCNRYYIPSGAVFQANGTTKTFAQWQALGYDVNSSSGAVTFTHLWGTDATDYVPTGTWTGIDLGTTISTVTDDIEGTTRQQGAAYDIGAFEYFENSASIINIRGKLILQGPFNTNLMNTNLSQNGLLPNAQPFNTSPWNYNGSESLGSGSTSSYVDWVLVELRNSSNPTQVVARKAAILKNDGSLLNTDGSNGVPFSNLQEGSYYVAVFHRNHLAIMSAAPIQLSANTPTYDFTTGLNKAYGQNPMKELAPGKYGMFAGDGNSNGGITIADRNEVWAPQNGTMGYLKGDFNLDGGVTASDVNLFWNINNGTMTQVP